MISSTQIKLIEEAYKFNPEFVRQIFMVADLMGDEDTLIFIAENYFEIFSFEDREKVLKYIKD